MKRFTAFALIFMMFFSNIAYNVSAAVNTGQSGQVLQGDYVVIVNTSLQDSQSTGTIIFDDSGININSINEMSSNEDVKEASEEVTKTLNLDGEESNINTKIVAKTTYNIGHKMKIGPTPQTKKDYTLIGIGANCYIWMEDSIKAEYDKLGKTDLAASEMIKVYEGAPYEILNELSNNNIPYLDNSGKLSILIENTGGNSGFYWGESDITAIHINAKDAKSFAEGSFDGLNGLLAHEGQHALFRLLICGGDTNSANLAHNYSWINEGISVAVMDKLWGYYDNNGWLTRINDSEVIRNGSSLLYSDYRGSTVQDYSMQYLFVRYLAAQATNNGNPIDFLKTLYTMDARGKTVEEFMNEIISKISNLNGKTFKDVLGSFYVAAFSPEKSGEYSFYGDTVVTEKVTSYPVYMGESNKAINLEPTAAIVVKTSGGLFTVPSDAGSDIKFYAVTKNNDIYKPANGSGTASDPYIINNEDELNSIGKYPSAYFKLGKDIEVTGKFYTANNFSGVLDGQGYTINNLDKPLIYTNNGSIRNLNVNADIDMEVGSNFGVIANINSGSISDIKVSGSLNLKGILINANLKPTIGGIVGENQPSGVIERSGFEANVTVSMPASETIVGGIVGYNIGTVSNTYAKGSINVFQNNSGTFILNLGGLIGRYKYMGVGASLKNSYSTMTLNYTGLDSTIKTVGSLVGSIISSASVNDSYGIDNYNPIGNDSNNQTGKVSLEALKNQSTFKNWDFNATWKMDTQGDGTPIFKNGNDINSISASLYQTNYFVGEKLNLSHGDILSVNGASIQLTEQMLNMEEFDSSTVGNDKVITGSYMGKEFTVKYNIVTPSKVEGLQIAKDNYGEYCTGKIEYVEGENYSQEGVVLEAKLNDSQYYTKIYSGFTNNLSNPLTKNDTEVEFDYFGGKVKQGITVKEKQVSSITVYNKADKSTYVPGNKVDLNGIRYQINYNDGSKSIILGYSDLTKYNLKVAQTDNDGKNAVEFDLNKVLDESDNSKKLYIYYGSTLPGQSGAISAEVVTLSVKKRLYMEDVTFRGALNKEVYWWTESLKNANYDVITTKVSGDLPPGIVLNSQPNNNGSDSFRFSGTPTKEGTYVVIYNIEKIDGSDSIDVTFTFNIENVSNEAKIEEIFLLKSDNTNLPGDIKGIIDETNNTIKFTVPSGTDISKLIARPTFYKNSTLPVDFKWYSGLDFTNSLTNPILYVVTAEDGVTTKTYKLSVEVLPEADVITSIDISNKISDIKVGASHTFIAELNGFGNYNKNVKWEVKNANSTSTTIDSNGKLTIGNDETSTSIEVIAIAEGDISKVIQISINVIQKEQLPKVTELAWDKRLAKWGAVLTADTYELRLYKDGTLIETIILTANSYDLTEVIRTKGVGEYSFTVVAKSDAYKDSVESDKSNVFKFNNAKPVIDGIADKEIEFGANFDPKEGVSARDEEDGNYSVDDIKVEGTVDSSNPNTYTLKYSVTDSDNNTTTEERKITVKDKPVTPPIQIKLEKVENLDWNGMVAIWDKVENATRYRVALYKNDKFVVEKVIDSNGAEISSISRTVNSLAYDFSEYFNEDGDYKFTVIAEADGYISSDISGEDTNVSDNVNEFINTAPEIQANNKTIKVGDSFNELADVKAMDKEEGDITNKIEVIKNTVNTNTPGVYEVTYKVADKQGLETTKTIYVTVRSNEKPVINGADNIDIKVGTVFDIKANVEAIDNEDGNLTNRISITGNFDYNTVGEYKITYSVTDDDGNTTTIVRTINVVQEDIENAVINANNKTIKVGDSFNILEGVTVTDSNNPNIMDALQYEGNVDTTKAGVYPITYKVVGSNGVLVTKTISVTVLSNENPVITGADDIEIKFGSNFDARKDVVAMDYEDLDLTDKIVITGEVNTNVSGEYEITYSVTDNDGNTTTIIRKVKVKKQQKPVEPEQKPVLPENPITPEVPSVPENPEVDGDIKPETPQIPEKPQTPVNPEKPETEDKPENSVMTEEQVKPDSSENKEDIVVIESDSNKNELPQTGAAVSSIQTSIFAMLSIAIGTLLKRRKRK